MQSITMRHVDTRGVGVGLDRDDATHGRAGCPVLDTRVPTASLTFVSWLPRVRWTWSGYSSFRANSVMTFSHEKLPRSTKSPLNRYGLVGDGKLHDGAIGRGEGGGGRRRRR